MKMKRTARVLAAVLVFVMICGFAVSAAASDGTVEVEMRVYGFDQSTPLGGVRVLFFGQSKLTNGSGLVTFKLRNLKDSESGTFEVKNSGTVFGQGPVNIQRSADSGIEVRPSGGPGDYGINLYYNDFTEFFIITSFVDQGNAWNIQSVDFDEVYPDVPQPAPEEPQPQEPHPEEPPVEDPDQPQFEEPRPEEPEPGMEELEPWMEQGPRFDFRIDPLMIGLIAAVVVLLVVVIVLAAKKGGKKKKKAKKGKKK